MKINQIITSLILLIGVNLSSTFALSDNGDGISWLKNVEGQTFEQVKTQAKAQNKKIFLDFYTKWCGPCKAMDKNVFSQKKIGDFYNKNFINFKVDAEVGEGIELARKYRVTAYPTFIFTNAEGVQINKGSSIGRSNVEGMIELARIALGEKVKTWEEYQAEYAASDKKDPDFLMDYINARLKYTRKIPSTELLWEWVQALPQETLFENKRARNTIKSKARPGNNFYQLLVANKDKFPELKEKLPAMVFIYNTSIQMAWDKSIDFEAVKKQLKTDFPEHADMAFQYYEVDQMRFNEATRENYLDAYFEFVDTYDMALTTNKMLIFSLIRAKNLKKEHAVKGLSMTELNENPSFEGCAMRAYLLWRSGQEKEAQELAKKYHDLATPYEGNGKMAWFFNTLRMIEKGKAPQPNL